jgi:hypothetical protein
MAQESMIVLSEVERELVSLAIEHNEGSFGLQTLLAAVKRHLPAERWQSGGDLTEWQIRKISDKLLAQGLLTAEDKSAVPPKPRRQGREG